jgi:type IV secretion system protein VirB10
VSDPRIALEREAQDIRPIVTPPRSGLSGPAIGGLAVLAGLILFGTLEARRRDATIPTTTRVAQQGASVAPPPLDVPAEPTVAPAISFMPPAAPTLPAPLRTPQLPATRTPAFSPPPSSYQAPQPTAVATPRNVGGATLVVDTSATGPAAGEGNAPTEAGGRGSLSTTRVRAAMLANRTTTVPQGTLIPAVLETAFDSTSPGFARALVQRDIRGFDGARVLIPRGSRLIGEYGADVSQGQKRAVILWARLIRPDGVTIAIGSPAADTLGRGGVKADVNSHFFERFSGAILQSVLDVGVALAARNSGSPVVVALPGSIGGAATTSRARATDIAPTLRVPAGRSVSVFVARDLDFTAVDTAP